MQEIEGSGHCGPSFARLQYATCKFMHITYCRYSYYSVKAFLPKMFWDADEKCRQLVNEEKHQSKSTDKYVADVVEICENLLTYRGVFFDVTVSLISNNVHAY